MFLGGKQPKIKQINSTNNTNLKTNKMKKQHLILGLLLACFQLASAQFTLEGEFRPRSEYFGNGGNFTGGSFPAQTAVKGDEGFVRTTVRAALKATYATEAYKVHINFQEVFAFGDRQQIATAGNGNFRVQEAWADLKLGEFSTLKIGRQPLSYDDQRILGGLGWAQQARTHDAAVFKYKKDGYNLDIGASLNTTTDEVYNNVTLFTYRDMVFMRANKKFDKLNFSALALVNTFQNGTALSPAGSNKATLITAGLHAGYKAGALGLSANLFLQEGNRVVGSYQDVSGAYLASLDATLKASDKVTLLAGIESISGAQDDSAGFFPLFGTNHKFNGLIDRFYVGNHANANGLVDINFGAKFALPKGYNLTAKFHNFSEESGDGNALGNELDLVVAKGFKGYKLVGGYSHFFEPDTAPANAKDTQNWAWLMLVIKPKFLNGLK